MKKLSVIIAVLYLGELLCQGQEPASRSEAWLAPAATFGFSEAGNYSVTGRFLSPLPSLSRAWVSFEHRNEEQACLPQEGNSLTEGKFSAESFVRLDGNSSVEGAAAYSRGKKANVVWNETSDFRLLFPYIQADSVGGDMQKECYSISGSFSARKGNWSYGLLGYYKALHEWRSTDPRPRNISSDLKAAVSAGYRLGAYTLGASLSYRRYHQSQAVTFVNPLGANTFEMHFTGLGSQYGRFASSGTFTSARYRGDGFGASLFLIPKSAGPFFSGLSYRQLSITKQLISQNEAPVSELLTHDFGGFAAFRKSLGSWFLGIKAAGACELRRCREVIIDNQASGSYQEIARLEMLRYHIYSAGFSALLQKSLGQDCLSLEPEILLKHFDGDYVYPRRRMGLGCLDEGISLKWLHRKEGKLAMFALKYLHSGNLSKQIDLPSKYTDSKILAAYNGFYDKWSDSSNALTFSAMKQWSLNAENAVSVKGSAGGVFFGRGDKSIYLTISTGILF